MKEHVAGLIVAASMVAATACGALLGARDPIEVSDGGALATSDAPAPTPEIACGDLYDALGPCSFYQNGHRDRFVRVCALELSAPGAAPSIAATETCAAAMRAAAPACGYVDACAAPKGTLPEGAACGSDLQCATGFCSVPSFYLSGYEYGGPMSLNALPSNRGACGTCARKAALGETCGTFPSDGPPCEDDAYCAALGPPGPTEGPHACMALPPPSDVGGPCSTGFSGGNASQPSSTCKPGLWCNTMLATPVCAAPGDAGAPCGVCAGDLVCAGGVCTEGLAEGAACNPPAGSAPCKGILECVGAPPTCQHVTPTPPGATCDYYTRLCATGYCSGWMAATMTGTCPTVVAEGQACDTSDAGATCDDFATCGVPMPSPPPFGGDASTGGGGGGGGAGGGPGGPPPVDAGVDAPTCVLFDPGACR